ncbi:hypothetical protein KJ836_03925, partial [Patescibacteria group bacterium]|nr:hypothetical protein [Patescibacteria group bacterium]
LFIDQILLPLMAETRYRSNISPRQGFGSIHHILPPMAGLGRHSGESANWRTTPESYNLNGSTGAPLSRSKNQIKHLISGNFCMR